MTQPRLLLCLLAIVIAGAAQAADKPLHLFILSGQSNMNNLDPKTGFLPRLRQELPDADILYAKAAWNGNPIERWHERANEERGTPARRGRKYRQLWTAIQETLGDRRPDTVTFIWMQGEADTRQDRYPHYRESFHALVGYLKEDLGRDDLNVVIGRISDYANSEKYPDWNQMRELQVAMAEENKDWAWIDTDDLNGKSNGLHYPKAGYTTLGERFAEAAARLIRQRAGD